MRRSIIFITAVAVAVPSAGIATARPTAKKPVSPGVVLGGHTAQSWPIVIETSHDGREVVRIDVALSVKCPATGTSSVWSDIIERVPISSTGRFSATSHSTAITLASGQKGDVSDHLKGTINARRTAGSGTWSFDVIVHDPTTNAVVDTCHSGNVTWKVKQ
jgi:hypothetical protein